VLIPVAPSFLLSAPFLVLAFSGPAVTSICLAVPVRRGTADQGFTFKSLAITSPALALASADERAVELLRLSLKSSRFPIVIDQPEDDLDTAFLASSLVDLVQLAKRQNQLIFASHNANLVVHGDTEKVHVMSNFLVDDAELCGCELSGTIDQEKICDSIEYIMEGGRAAFEQRRMKYHETIYPLKP